MSNYPVGRRPRSADPHSTLRIAALTAVAAGVVLLAAAAFVLSYPGIHQIALQAGVSADVAKLYPVIFDAMLVVAGAAAMALRGAGWWSRFYAWACLILLLVAVAVGDAMHATGTALPEPATRAALAITPWVLLLLAFGLLLTMLSHFRKARAAVAARQEARAAAAGNASMAGDTVTGGQPTQANGSAAGRPPVTWATASVAGAAAGTAGTATATQARPQPPQRFGLDFWLGPRQAQTPATETPYGTYVADTGEDASHGDPVSYGVETGYVHPDSFRDEGEYSPHGDSGGPGTYAGSGQDAPAEAGEHAAQEDIGGDGRPTDAAAQAGNADTGAQADQAGAAAQAAGTHTDQADAGTQADQAEAAAQAGQADAGAQADQADAEAQADQAEAAAQADQADAGAQASQADAGAQVGKADAGTTAAQAGAEAQAAGAQADQADAGAQADQADTGTQADQDDTRAQADQADAAAQAGKADTGAQAGKADATAQAGQPEAAANGGPAKEHAQDEGGGEPAAAQSPVLERVRSTPTRPEE